MFISQSSCRLSRAHSNNTLLKLPYFQNRLYCKKVFMATDNSQQQKLDKTTSEDVWKQILSAEEYHVLREKGTEPAGTGKYNKFYEEGQYVCAACQTPLYESETKFDSGCGWPAFYDNMSNAVERNVDNSFGMQRIEIVCKNCGAHLGHVFQGEGFPTPTNERHCVNSVSIKFQPKEK
eukprot:TRINITY_DN7856_c0_g1_i11.p1 TRINITY_DN7856_c0_g1~~TRINITY_DN7856_c0_g1_i11.p1  ORF type:complete len:178 (-),score=13.94 TRINITY_DN7856_c0_g1_i11:202-735(-)